MPKDFNSIDELSSLAPKTLGKEVSDPILDVLLAARQLIKSENGWCKVDFGRDGGPHCIIGSLINVEYFGKVGPYTPAHDYLKTFLPSNPGHGSLMFFNDASETTHADVLSLFTRAIESRRTYLAERV